MYFDFAATTPMDDDILEVYLKMQKEYYANTTSLHKFGQTCNSIYEQAKDKVRAILKVEHEVIYTSNATEANNIAILGFLRNKKGKIITTKIEHPSVIEVFKSLEGNDFEVVYLDIDHNGIIDMEQLKKEMTKDVLLVSIMWVNNIVGSIQPIREIIEIIKQYPKAKFHCDTVQGICKIVPDFLFSDIDMFTFSSHKFYGPKGIGCLVYKKNLELQKIMFGSNAQNGLKPGTFDLGLVVGCVKALDKYFKNQEKNWFYVGKLNEYIRIHLTNPRIIINSGKKGSPYIINISKPQTLSETLTHILEEKNLYVSTGSACSSKMRKPERTIFAMTKNEEIANTTIRISLSHITTQDEVQKLVEVLNSL